MSDHGVRRIAVLGSTGSIGTQTLDVARRHPDKLQVVALAAGTRATELGAQAAEFGVDEECTALAADGEEALLALCRLPEVDLVVNALVGAAGLRASVETLSAGKVLALANKESLVVGGDLLCSAVFANGERVDAAIEPDGASRPCFERGTGKSPFGSKAGDLHSSGSISLTSSRSVIPCTDPSSLIRPIDSEHGAIYQCLIGEDMREVSCLWVTASGGPFRGKKREDLRNITPEQALAHPTWNMGRKISIDSSTLMNKGLEIIEAHHLFAMPYDRIRVVVQPQSAIHSMVEFSDGSVKAHLGTTDMRIPIQYALSYPERWDAPVQSLDFTTLGSLQFEAPDTETFRCLALAREAGQIGGTLPCVMNAANEIAVAAFLARECSYLGIAETVEAVMDAHTVQAVESVDQLLEVDAWARGKARSIIAGVA